jgi:hypothetical protein
MFGPSKKLSAFSNRTVRLTVVGAAAGIALASCATYLAWRYPCLSREPGLRGEVQRTPNGQFLYFNGECWTARPMPPTDTPF